MPKRSSDATASKKPVNTESSTPAVKAKKPRKKREVNLGNWSHEEKQRFVTGLNKKFPFRKEDGNIDWLVLKGFIGRHKNVTQVKEYAKRFHALEHGNMYPEFSTRAAVDIWRQLAEASMNSDDNIANVCVPQVMTVAALEPLSQSSGSTTNYSNIYNYLNAVTRGSEVPDLPPDDAVVVLELLEDLIKLLSKSETLLQRDFMHGRYAELRKLLFNADGLSTISGAEKPKNSSSTNPYSIPFEVLDFKRGEHCD